MKTNIILQKRVRIQLQHPPVDMLNVSSVMEKKLLSSLDDHEAIFQLSRIRFQLSEGFVWVDGMAHHGNLTWQNGNAIDGYTKDNVGILGPFNDSCVSANDKWRKLSVKSCSIKQSFACQV